MELEMKNRNVAIVGATGAVGREFVGCIESRGLPLASLKLLASARSAGKTQSFRGKELVIEELTGQLEASGVPYEVKFAGDALDPADELLRAADAADAEFIVIGLRRRSPVGKLLLGSNAQRVLLDAACPVLAVKAAPDA